MKRITDKTKIKVVIDFIGRRLPTSSKELHSMCDHFISAEQFDEICQSVRSVKRGIDLTSRFRKCLERSRA